MDPLSTFRQRQTHFQSLIDQIQRLLDRIAWMRLAVFLVALGVEIVSWRWGGAWWMLMLLLGMVGFGMVVRWNEQVKQKLRFQQALLRINGDEILRLEGKLNGFEDGHDFIDGQHAYSSDLDIFGKHSLYQLVNRAATRFGRRRLAAWLLGTADVPTIQARQEAAANLASQIDWRQNFQAIAELQEDKQETAESLGEWLREPSYLATRPALKYLPWVMMGAMALCITLVALGVIHGAFLALSVMGNLAVNRSVSKVATRVQIASSKRGKLLSNWAKLISEIESVQGGGAAVDQLQQRLLTDGKLASAEIKSLAKIVANLEFRYSGLPYAVVNTLGFWDIFCMRALEKWKARLGERVMDWFEVIGEVEAFNSLAAIQFAFPNWSKPEIVDGAFLLEATDMGHPLIPQQQRVDNPMAIAGNGTIWLVTGSNMSGKSTYLRTAGVNVVLALMGAPVCAKSMRLTPMQVATSMRTTDNLEENTSSFYAELKRLKSVIELVRSHKNTFFLLDEILKGTNSRDRQAGARALVQQLHKLGGAGLVSTHDIELVDMAAQLPLAIHNYSFNCTVTPDGQLEFDYKLTEGQCLSMNATALMRAMGIEL